MSLLIKRDTTVLVPAEGFAEGDLPHFLKAPRIVPQYLVTELHKHDNDDLFLKEKKDLEEMTRHLNKTPGRIQFAFRGSEKLLLPALWSGRRSVLTKDPKNDGFFKIKGVATNLAKPKLKRFKDGNFWIDGGQKLESVEYERRMSEKFNSALKAHGLEPVMEYAGRWVYAAKAKGHDLAASIFHVKGDTRLDELMDILDTALTLKVGLGARRKQKFIDSNQLSRNGRVIYGALYELYSDLGFAAGRLKKLLDTSGQAWSGDSGRSNAYIGNIVLYRDGKYLQMGLVDFDSSWDMSDCTPRQLERLQKKERRTIIQSVNGISMSARPMFTSRYSHRYSTNLRDYFTIGFKEGYSSRREDYAASVRAMSLDCIVRALRSPESIFKEQDAAADSANESPFDRWLYDKLSWFLTTPLLGSRPER